MSRRFFAPLSALCLLFLAALLLMHSEESAQAAAGSLELFALRVFPALFPYFVITRMMADAGAMHRIGRALRPAMRLAGLPDCAGAAFLTGAVSGYPAGARIAGELYARGELTRAQCERVTLFSNLPGPMFVSATVAASMLGIPGYGLHMAGAQIAAAVFLFLAVGLGKRREQAQSAPVPKDAMARTAAASFTDAVADGMAAMLKVCGTMVFFAVFAAILRASGVFALAALPLEALGVESGLAEAVMTALFEQTTGCEAIAALALPLNARAALCAFAVGSGGLSILAQTVCFAPVRAGRYAAWKLVAGLVAGGVTYAMIPADAAAGAFGGAFAPALLPLALWAATAVAAIFLHGERRIRAHESGQD